MKSVIAGFIVLFCLPAMSQSQIFATGGMDAGGSGHGLVCFSNAAAAQEVKKSVGNISDDQLLSLTSILPVDLWFARMPNGQPPRIPILQLPTEDESEFDFLERILRAVDRTLPALAGKIRMAEKAFRPHNIKIKWVPISIQMILDSGLNLRVDQMPMCAIAMLAWQTTIEGAHFLQIDPRLYSRMDKISRTTLWLHEYVYWIARRYGQKDSRATRELVATLLLDGNQIRIGELAELSRSLGFLTSKESARTENPGAYYPTGENDFR